MLNFLSIRKGYCEQFAGTFAAMARSVGLPARVVVGFTPGVLRSDGLYHVMGRHAHAWAEVWFDGFGWTSFDPTPGRGAPGAEQHTGAQAQQDEGTGATGGNTAEAAPQPTFVPPSIARDRPETGPAGPRPPRDVTLDSPADKGSAGGWIVAALVLALLAWAVAMPRALNRWSQHRKKPPAERVASAWAATVRSLTMAGAPRPAGATPLEYSRSIDIGRAEAVEIARLVTRAVYSPKGVDAGAATRSELLSREVDAVCRTRMTLSTRVLDHLDPRSAWRRIAG
jgi:hypothetical protein